MPFLSELHFDFPIPSNFDLDSSGTVDCTVTALYPPDSFNWASDEDSSFEWPVQVTEPRDDSGLDEKFGYSQSSFSFRTSTTTPLSSFRSHESPIKPKSIPPPSYNQAQTPSNLVARAIPRLELETCPEPGCGARFENSTALRKHRDAKHGLKLYHCGHVRCQRFSTKKDLNRHLKSGAHPTQGAQRSPDASVYSCGCGKKFLRKDHYKDHIKRPRCRETGSFGCACGRASDRCEDQLDHMKSCKLPGSRPRGRPRKKTERERNG